MSLTTKAPNTVHLGGMVTYLDELPAVETIRPGMVVEYHDDSGALSLGVHDTADDPASGMIALERIEMNEGIDHDYLVTEMVKVGIMHPGARFYALVPSGQNITQGAYLQSNGDGKLKAVATGKAFAVAIETIGAVNADTRIRVEVL